MGKGNNNKKGFISYGRDNYALVAEQFKKDLIKRGYIAWFDKDRIKTGDEWPVEIDVAIEKSNWVVYLMSPHSVREESWCIREVSYAMGLEKKVLPLMLEKVELPFCIINVHYLDIESLCVTDKKGDKVKIRKRTYKKILKELISVIEKKKEIREIKGLKSSAILPILEKALEPLDNNAYFDRRSNKFVGRKWLFEKFDTWVKDKSSKVFVLEGGPGTGKTAFVKKLCDLADEDLNSTEKETIGGIHFCKFDNSDRNDVCKAIKSLAYHLAARVPEYAAILLTLQDLKNLKEKNANRLFEYLFIEPLLKIDYNKPNPIILVIDALDEAGGDRSDLVNVIATSFSQTPEWLKLLVTTRPEADIVRRLNKFEPTVINDHRLNNEDIYEYLKGKLDESAIKYTENDLIKLKEKCEGSFLYATEIIKMLEEKTLSIQDVDKFPKGINEKYRSDFDRLFKNNEELKNKIEPILEIILAAYEPFSVEKIAKVLDKDKNDISKLHDHICTLFPIKNNAVTLIHKSLYDWLVDRDMSGDYSISLTKGHKSISSYYRKIYEKGVFKDDYLIKHLAKHTIGANFFEYAAEVLMDAKLFDKKEELLGTQSSLKAYLSELEWLSKEDDDLGYAEDVMKSDFFVHDILTKRHKVIYDNAMYAQIKNCGFDAVEKDIEKTDVMVIHTIASYYHITERSDVAVPLLLKSIEIGEAEKVGNKLFRPYNLLGLCYLDLSEFEKARKYFKLVEKTADLTTGKDHYYQHAIANINLAKIENRLLNFDSAIKRGYKALDYLKKEYELMDAGEEKRAKYIYIALFHRFIAEYAIWKPDLEIAKKELEKSNEIYMSEPTRDRYFVKYKYKIMLLDVLSGDADKAIQVSDELLKEVTADYDKTQVLFHKAFAYYCKDLHDEALALCNEALNIATLLKMPLVEAELETLKSICKKESIKDYKNNEINNWCKHIGKVILETKEKY